jgi:hypothetical protein
MGKLCSKKELADFAQEERDFEWAIQMEQRISDFIVTHELAYTVELVTVECKSTSCQIAGYEEEAGTFGDIINKLKEEPWFELNSSSSFSSSTSFKTSANSSKNKTMVHGIHKKVF